MPTDPAAAIARARRAIADYDRHRVRQTRTLRDLCDLTIDWLEGRTTRQPANYNGPVDVDDAPYLREALVACNRAGFLTYNSQCGHNGRPGSPGQSPLAESWWMQLACVDGYADDATLEWICAFTDVHGFGLIAHPCKTAWWRRARPGVTVTWTEHQGRDGRITTVPRTRFGRQAGRATIAGEFYPDCHPAAIDTLCNSWQIVIYDAEPGPNTLWPLLNEAVNDLFWRQVNGG